MKYLVIISLFLIFSCDDESESRSLPPITDTGENTFGCKVNGEVWIPSWSAFCRNKGDEIYKGIGKDFYRISPQSCIGQPGGILGFLFWVYHHNNKIDSIVSRTTPRNNENNTNFSTIVKTFKGKDLDDFNFNIIIGNNSDILHGTFEFDLVDTSRNVTYEIREGRLDVPFEK